MKILSDEEIGRVSIPVIEGETLANSVRRVLRAICEAQARLTREETLKEVGEWKAALEADAADLWRVTNAIKKEIGAREWIMEGRGCYAWDDDRYKDETRLAFEAVLKLIRDVQHPAQLRFAALCNRQMPES